MQSKSIAGIKKIVENLSKKHGCDQDCFVIEDGATDWVISCLLEATKENCTYIEYKEKLSHENSYPNYTIKKDSYGNPYIQ